MNLKSDERRLLIDSLQVEGDMSWAAVRKILNLTKKETIGHTEVGGKKKAIKRGYTFNLQENEDKKLLGNRTAAKLCKHIPEVWRDLGRERQTQMVDEIISFESEKALAKRLESAWDLDPGQADAVSKTVLEQGYANHSRKAISRFLPRLREGDQYGTIRREEFPEQFETNAALDFLPPVLEAAGFDQIKNPAVMRTLSELRKVVNAIVRLHGKPSKIRIELARDLKHARKRREEFAQIRDQNEKARTAAARKIIEQTKDESLIRNRANILKVRLAEECGWICPYSGDPINMKQLVVSPQFEIEHIIPYSKCFDNSFVNKTLCRVDLNREKANRTPVQAFGGRDDFEAILSRVNRFQGGLASRKLALFTREEPLPNGEFTNRMLNDTRYISRKACEYVGLLYGGVVDEDGTRRVQALAGRCTANLRNNWDLNRILGHPAKKERADHRHHAIDAIVIAVTDQSLVKKMSKAAEVAEEQNTRMLFEQIDAPWPDFQKDVRSAIDRIVVSSRVSKTVNGSLHKDTILSHPKSTNAKGIPIHHVRKPLESLTAREVEAIVDPVVREKVQTALEAIGLPPAKAFSEPGNIPCLISKKDPSRVIPIRRVRIRKSDKPVAVGKGAGRRYVNPGSNNHMEIVALMDDDGNEKSWEGILVSSLDAMTRKRNGLPVVSRDHGPKRLFKYSICPTEHLQYEEDEGLKIVRVLSISEGDIECIAHQDARPAGLRRKNGSRLRFSLSKLKKHQAKKVVITPLGQIFDSAD